MRINFAIVALAALLALPAPAQESPIPERRLVLTEGTDLPGGDIRQIFDTTLDTCQRACLADRRCVALTFNARSGACFPKSETGAAAPYAGAISGPVVAADAAAHARAMARATDLRGILTETDLASARSSAQGFAGRNPGDGRDLPTLNAAASAARAAGLWEEAARDAARAVTLSDSSANWYAYAELTLRAALSPDAADRWDGLTRARDGAANGYLRAQDDAARAGALATLALTLEQMGRGRDMIPALRLAQSLEPAPATLAALEEAVGKYGFRITDTQIDNATERPRICAIFSEPLAAAGVDYAPFVRLPAPGLSVEAEGAQLCVGGVEHGQRYAFTFRRGLPSAAGETLPKDVPLVAYVRDRTAAAWFPGRAYVLPRAGGTAIPVTTVNTGGLDLSLSRVSDRALVRSMQEDFFASPLSPWQAEDFGDHIATEIWKGTATVPVELNRDVTTRLPLEAAGTLGAGVYVLRAVPQGTSGDQPAPQQWFVVSDLGLTTMSGSDGLHVFVQSLASARPVQGVTVTLVSRGNAVLGTAETDAEGKATLAPGFLGGNGAGGAALVTARLGDDLSFLSLTDPEFDLSDRGVAGREAAPPIDVFLTTDRGVYRPGETVNVTALARDGKVAALTDLPLTARLSRPDGVEYSRTVAPDAGAGGHVWALALGVEVPRGLWRLDVLADTTAPPLASATVLVEDFLPERIDVSLSLPDGPVTLDERVEAGVEARYLFGPPAGDLAVEGEVRLRAAASLAGYPGYRFGLSEEPFEPQLSPLPSGLRTDADGQLRLTLPFPRVDLPPARPLEAEVVLRVAEGSGRPVERRSTLPVLPGTPMIGVKPAPDGVVPQGGEARFDVIALSAEGTQAALPIRWVLDRVETRYQWYRMSYDWNWEPVTTRSRVAEGEGAVPADGSLPITTRVDWGHYELRVEAADGSPIGTSVAFDAGWYAQGDATATPDRLEVSLDKPSYHAGDTAVLRIAPREGGQALVSVLSNRLIESRAVTVTSGETRIDLPVTEDWGTGAYVTVSLLRPLDVAAGHNPARTLGLAHAAIDPGPRRLAATFDMAPTADPRGPLEAVLKVPGAGPDTFATIAAVDVGILNLTGFESPDPEGHYFGQRRLGIGIRDLYGRLIDGLSGAMGTVRSGGDAGAQARMQGNPPTEAVVSYFSGPLPVQNGEARARFDLPAFNGTVRLMAVVWSPGAVGQAETEVTVRDPVVVTASLPRFLAPGDQSRLLLEFVHASGPAGTMPLTVSTEGVEVDPAPAAVELTEGGKARLSLPLRADDPGSAHLRIALTTPEGRELTKDLTLTVRRNDPAVARTSRIDLAPGQTLTFDRDIFADFQPGSGSATVALGPVARLDAPGLLRNLALYPYGCTEQLASRLLPLLYFDDMIGSLSRPDETPAARELIRAIINNQSASGGFGLWQAGSGDLWLDAYVTDVLGRARQQGHDVPDRPFRTALDNLRNQLNFAPDFDSDGGPYAYAMMILAREGAASADDLRYYADVKAAAFDTPLAAAQLAAALANVGDQPRADRMFAEASRMVTTAFARSPERIWRNDFGSERRDTAGVLALAAEAGSRVVDEPAIVGFLGQQAAASASTQEAAWTLLAARALSDGPGTPAITVNGAPAEGSVVRALADAASAEPVAIRNGSDQPASVTLTAFGIPRMAEPAGGQGYAIERSYYTLTGEPVDAAVVAAGTRLVAVIEVTPTESVGARLIIDDPLPAGFEIDNPALLRAGDVSALDWFKPTEGVNHTEFRDDRFIAQVDNDGVETIRLAYVLRAISPGQYHHPAASVADMYRPDFRAVTGTGRLTVTP